MKETRRKESERGRDEKYENENRIKNTKRRECRKGRKLERGCKEKKKE